MRKTKYSIYYKVFLIIFICLSCEKKDDKKDKKSTLNLNTNKQERELPLDSKKVSFHEEDCQKCATITLTYPDIQGDQLIVSGINTFITELLTGNMIYSENTSEDVESYANSFFAYYKKYKSEEKSSMQEQTWSLDITIEVLYNKNNIITLKSIKTAQENLEKPIKSTFVYSLRYAPDFEIISISNSILQLSQLKELLLAKFKEVHGFSKNTNLVEKGYWTETIEVPEFVGVIDNKLLFSYDYNELGPEELGYTELLLTFDELSDLVDFAKLGLL